MPRVGRVYWSLLGLGTTGWALLGVCWVRMSRPGHRLSSSCRGSRLQMAIKGRPLRGMSHADVVVKLATALSRASIVLFVY